MTLTHFKEMNRCRLKKQKAVTGTHQTVPPVTDGKGNPPPSGRQGNSSVKRALDSFQASLIFSDHLPNLH